LYAFRDDFMQIKKYLVKINAIIVIKSVSSWNSNWNAVSEPRGVIYYRRGLSTTVDFLTSITKIFENDVNFTFFENTLYDNLFEREDDGTLWTWRTFVIKTKRSNWTRSTLARNKPRRVNTFTIGTRDIFNIRPWITRKTKNARTTTVRLLLVVYNEYIIFV